MAIYKGLPICKQEHRCVNCGSLPSKHHGKARSCYDDKNIAIFSSAPESSVGDLISMAKYTYLADENSQPTMDCEQGAPANHRRHELCSGMSFVSECKHCEEKYGYHIPVIQNNEFMVMCDMAGDRCFYSPAPSKRVHNEAYIPLTLCSELDPSGIQRYYVGAMCPVCGPLSFISDMFKDRQKAQEFLDTWHPTMDAETASSQSDDTASDSLEGAPTSMERGHAS